jgi:hypothetical protein
MAGFRRGDRRLHRLQIAHFADQDDVRILAQGAPHRLAKIRNIHADIALGNHAFLVRVVILDRILDRNNVAVALNVDHVEHAGQRRALAGTGRSGDQNQAPRLIEQIPDLGRQADLLRVISLDGIWRRTRPIGPSA